MNKQIFSASSNYYSEEGCSVEDFVSVIEAGKTERKPSFASMMVGEIPLYDAPAIRKKLAAENSRQAVYSEWSHVLEKGCGIVVIRNAFSDKAIVDEASVALNAIIESERGKGAADHFAKAGANDRVWNALEKLCYANPDIFARYYANEMIAAISEAWLGPNYQVTSQINAVKPGGEAQSPHRDYHLGFQTIEQGARYPAQVHHFSHFLTLQGAVAHCDMPLESGPTKLLPYSQRYLPGYMAYRRKDFVDYFEAHHVQVPLEKGDLLFFSPALFHAAGSNKTKDVYRMANLLQVSSAYGIALEAINRTRLCKTLYPALLKLKDSKQLDETGIECAIAASAYGYSFPTNLDTDPPVGGLAPRTQNDLMHEALNEGWAAEKFNAVLDAQEAKRVA